MVTNGKDCSKASIRTMQPQIYLDLMLHERGYSIPKFSTLDSGYYSNPTSLQQASYSVHLLRLIRAKNTASLKDILKSGLSPNPCNKYGESLIHIICSRGNANMLKLQMDVGGSVQVSDKCGRTPLHEVCRRQDPCFKMAKMIASKDSNLFQMRDIYDACPLSYVPKEQWSRWNDFLASNVDRWWPKMDSSKRGEHVPALAEAAPNSRPIPDPENALTVELAGVVASGSIQPDEALLFSYDCSESEADLMFTNECEFDEQDPDMVMVHLKKHLSAKASPIKC